jgi:hypothetical protein
MTQQEIKSIVDKFADIARVLMDADLDDKVEIFRQPGLKLTFHPGRQLVKAHIEASQRWYFEECPRADTHLVTSGDAAAGRCAGD